MAIPSDPGEHSGVEYPELAARTRRFSHGAPRAVTVSGDGERVVFARSGGPTDPTDALWVFDLDTGAERLVADPATLLRDAADLPQAEQALRERLRLSAAGIGSFALDGAGLRATFTVAGELFVAELRPGRDPGVVRVPTAGPAVDPRLDPTGQKIAYVTAQALHVVDLAGDDAVLAAEPGVTWGLAEFIAAEEFRRFRGHWWSPDSATVLAARVDESRVLRWHLQDPSLPASAPRTVAYPAAGTDNAKVSLHLLDLDGGWVDVHWDQETYPYLTAVGWDEHSPMITVLRRSQQQPAPDPSQPLSGTRRTRSADARRPRPVRPFPRAPIAAVPWVRRSTARHPPRRIRPRWPPTVA